MAQAVLTFQTFPHKREPVCPCNPAVQSFDLCSNSVSFPVILWELKSKSWLSELFSFWHMLLIGIQVNMTPRCPCLCVVTSLHQSWRGFIICFTPSCTSLHLLLLPTVKQSHPLRWPIFRKFPLQITFLSWLTGLKIREGPELPAFWISSFCGKQQLVIIYFRTS